MLLATKFRARAIAEEWDLLNRLDTVVLTQQFARRRWHVAAVALAQPRRDTPRCHTATWRFIACGYYLRCPNAVSCSGSRDLDDVSSLGLQQPWCSGRGARTRRCSQQRFMDNTDHRGVLALGLQSIGQSQASAFRRSNPEITCGTEQNGRPGRLDGAVTASSGEPRRRQWARRGRSPLLEILLMIGRIAGAVIEARGGAPSMHSRRCELA